MTLKEQVFKGMKCCLNNDDYKDCSECPYDIDEENHRTRGYSECIPALLADFEQLISDMEGTIALLEETDS